MILDFFFFFFRIFRRKSLNGCIKESCPKNQILVFCFCLINTKLRHSSKINLRQHIVTSILCHICVTVRQQYISREWSIRSILHNRWHDLFNQFTWAIKEISRIFIRTISKTHNHSVEIFRIYSCHPLGKPISATSECLSHFFHRTFRCASLTFHCV